VRGRASHRLAGGGACQINNGWATGLGPALDEEIRPAEMFPRLTIAFGAILAALVAIYLANLAPPYDRWGGIVGRDFVNMWNGARMALAGHADRLSDPSHYLAELRRVFADATWRAWSYPPDLLLFVWPLGLMPYMAAWAVWSVGGLALYLFTAAGRDRSAKTLGALAAAPAVGVNLFFGQNGFFSAALIIGAVRELDRRPIVSGICLGLLTMKPQLGMLFPIALVVSGRWRCLVAAAATAVVLVLATGAVFGFGIWADYVAKILPYQTQVMTRAYGPGLAMMPSAFGIGRLWMVPTSVAFLFQAPFAIFAVVAVAWTFWKRRDPLLSAAVLVTAGFVATPYVFVYDMVVLGWLIAILHRRFGPDLLFPVLIWLLPLITMACGFVESLAIPAPPLAPLVLAAFLARLVAMLRSDAAAPAAA